MKTVPLVVTDTVNNSYQCYKVMADEDKAVRRIFRQQNAG